MATLIILNEQEYVEELLAGDCKNKNLMESMNLIARYYYQSGRKKSEIHEKLEEYILRRDPDVNLVKWQEALARISNRADKYPLVRIDGVPITQAELNICASAGGKQAQQVMFSLICLAKFAYMVNPVNSGWVNRDDVEVFTLANVVTSKLRRAFMLNDLREAGLIKFGKRVDNVNINVTCLDHEGAPAMVIRDMRNLGYQYQKQRGGDYIECAYCGATVKRINGAQRYCKDCAPAVHRERERERRERIKNTA